MKILSKPRYTRPLLMPSFPRFYIGDTFSVGYRLNGYGFVFTGICMRIKRKSMLLSNSTFTLRNIFSRISVEVTIALYSLCRTNFKMLDYARKHFFYRSSKLYYLRNKSNIESWVRS